MNIKILAEGGNMKPGPALSQKLGPAGINVNQVIQKINEATKDFEGLKVPIELVVDSSTKQFVVNVFSPPVSELIKRETGIEKGSGMQLKTTVGNASIEQIINVAKQKYQNLLCNDLKSAVKTVIGTCSTLGVLVENEKATEFVRRVELGEFDKEIEKEITVTSEKKKKALAEFLFELKKQQDKVLKQEQAAAEAAKIAAEAAKTTATAEAPVGATGDKKADAAKTTDKVVAPKAAEKKADAKPAAKSAKK